MYLFRVFWQAKETRAQAFICGMSDLDILNLTGVLMQRSPMLSIYFKAYANFHLTMESWFVQHKANAISTMTVFMCIVILAAADPMRLLGGSLKKINFFTPPIFQIRPCSLVLSPSSSCLNPWVTIFSGMSVST